MAETKKKAVKAEKTEEVKEAAPKAKRSAKKESAGLTTAPRASKETAPAEEKKADRKARKAEEPAPAPKKEVREARCIAKGVRITPRKVRLVADVVRGKDVAEALGMLKAINKSGSEALYKAIKSAASNATNNFGLDYESLYVAEIQVGDAFRIKRFIPRAKGSASPIIKRNCNIRVVVRERR